MEYNRLLKEMKGMWQRKRIVIKMEEVEFNRTSMLCVCFDDSWEVSVLV
jgi:hypothetical protein